MRSRCANRGELANTRKISMPIEVIDYLRTKGISTAVHYPVPLHLQPAMARLGYKMGHFPIAEKAADRIISSPMCGDLSKDEASFIAAEFLKVARL